MGKIYLFCARDICFFFFVIMSFFCFKVIFSGDVCFFNKVFVFFFFEIGYKLIVCLVV